MTTTAFRRRAPFGLVLAVAGLTSACAAPPANQPPATTTSAPATSTPGTPATPASSLTIAQAQATLSEWIRSDKGPSRDGSATVLSVRDTNGQLFALADLKVKAFPDEDGHISPTEDGAEAVFSRQNDGSWVLTSVVWDFGRRTAVPDLEVR